MGGKKKKTCRKITRFHHKEMGQNRLRAENQRAENQTPELEWAEAARRGGDHKLSAEALSTGTGNMNRTPGQRGQGSH